MQRLKDLENYFSFYGFGATNKALFKETFEKFLKGAIKDEHAVRDIVGIDNSYLIKKKQALYKEMKRKHEALENPALEYKKAILAQYLGGIQI